LIAKPTIEGEGEDDTAHTETKKGGRKSPTEIKLDMLKHTFSANFPGIKKNGRP
jgi:hypothetical protein